MYRNLSAFLEGRPLQRFDPGGDFLLIPNLGDGMGLFRRKGIFRSGRLAFQLKNYLDRYIKMGRAVADERSREVFLTLSREEQAHLEWMTSLLDR